MKLIGLDVGTKRIGVATADTSVRIAVPNCTIVVNGNEFVEIAKIAKANNTNWFVVGLPRNNNGEETKQTEYVREFAETLEGVIPGAKIRFQDESLTSVEAETRLKSRGRTFRKGEVDAEAATIILQDFIENFTISTNTKVSAIGDLYNEQKEARKQDQKKYEKAKKKTIKTGKESTMLKKLVIALVILVAVCGIGFGAALAWYNSAISPARDIADCTDEPEDSDCVFIDFTVSEGETIAQIATNLQDAGIIKSKLAFQIYFRTHHQNGVAKAGDYQFRAATPIDEICKQLIEGAKNPNVFSFTILPGETAKDVKKKLLDLGYSTAEVENAFSKTYNHPVFQSKPGTKEENAEQLEGYLFGDTYEFYKTDSVEKIITTALDAMYDVIVGNDLIAKYEKQGLSLYRGITLASIIEKEARNTTDSQGRSDRSVVAQIFLSRLDQGLALGSDITTQYAVDLVDPNREKYTDNAAALEIESPYNTRKYGGLPPGPVSNPSVSALLAVANPANTSYLYFLTGDDGKMYYSYTEDEHNDNIRQHCQNLCNVQL